MSGTAAHPEELERYLSRHRVREMMDELMSRLAGQRPEQPAAFMAAYLGAVAAGAHSAPAPDPVAADSNSGSLCILHFNDVYNLSPRAKEPVGGAARFVHKIRALGHLDPLVLFGGDAFSPALRA